ncbi:hypothetical protein [Streptomyces sp. N35]|uniref:hypothetical protein n=1 Tax=Streptomyces sp. N35 TaxID=2795730 RepID=UPI0018F561B7|nr:hypothetical protein [Streptomyces sp. N35]
MGQALAHRSADPFSARVTLSVRSEQAVLFTMDGRFNLNATRPEGSVTLRQSPGTAEESVTRSVRLGKTLYWKVDKGTGAGKGWAKKAGPQEVSRTDPDANQLPQYAELLLAQGKKARKGPERVDGVLTEHLSGRLTIAELRTVEPHVADGLYGQGLDAVECEIWVDGEGRVRRYEQHQKGSADQVTLMVMTVSEERAPEKFAAPIR